MFAVGCTGVCDSPFSLSTLTHNYVVISPSHIHCYNYVRINISGQQTSQNSSHAPPRGGPGVGPHYLFHAQQPPGHRNTPVSFPYSSSAASNSSGSGMSSSTGQQRRGKGWMAGGYCNEEGRPHSKRARMSTVVVADDEDTEHDKGKALDGRANMFITARNQHVSSGKFFAA